MAVSAGVLLAMVGAAAAAARLPSGDGGEPPTQPTPSYTTAGSAATDPTTRGPVTAPRTGPDGPVAGQRYPYDLYVHCGIRYARFGGRWWHAEVERPAPPPRPSRDGNYVTGTMTLVSADRARFDSDDPPLTVDFRPLAGALDPCA